MHHTSLTGLLSTQTEIAPAFEAAFAKAEQSKNELASAEARMEALRAKQGRCSQFSSRADRDKHLRAQAGELRSAAASKREAAQAAREAHADASMRLNLKRDEVAELEGQVSARQKMIRMANDDIKRTSDELDKQMSMRKELQVREGVCALNISRRARASRASHPSLLRSVRRRNHLPKSRRCDGSSPMANGNCIPRCRRAFETGSCEWGSSP